MQYLRVVLVTVSMPVVAAAVYGASADAVSGPEAAGAPWYLGLLLTVVCGAVGVPLARLLRIPAGGLLGPMTVALVLTLTGVAGGAVPPSALVELAYAVIGWQAGVRFTRESLRVVAGLAPRGRRADRGGRGGVRGAGRAAGAAHRGHPARGLPATTPGGIYAVLATAISSGVDVAFVVAVQVLRVVVMLLVAPAIARVVAAEQSGLMPAATACFCDIACRGADRGDQRPAGAPRPRGHGRRGVRLAAPPATPRAERYALGRRLRQRAPRSALGRWKPALGPARPRRPREGHQPWPRHAARAGADRPDVGLAVRLPPRCGGDHGRGLREPARDRHPARHLR